MSSPRRFLSEDFEAQYKDLDPAKLNAKIEATTKAYAALLRERRQVFYPVTEPSRGPWVETAGVQAQAEPNESRFRKN